MAYFSLNCRFRVHFVYFSRTEVWESWVVINSSGLFIYMSSSKQYSLSLISDLDMKLYRIYNLLKYLKRLWKKKKMRVIQRSEECEFNQEETERVREATGSSPTGGRSSSRGSAPGSRACVQVGRGTSSSSPLSTTLPMPTASPGDCRDEGGKEGEACSSKRVRGGGRWTCSLASMIVEGHQEGGRGRGADRDRRERQLWEVEGY